MTSQEKNIRKSSRYKWYRVLHHQITVVLLLLYWLIVLKQKVVELNPGVIHKPPPRTASGSLLCL